ncbi:pirin-like bicupin family protein [Labrenzia sp. 011]|uniref:pirin family protein n=1 Tax=Labrenzia sp. 011 TaxID=2171494 RepID=UPI000D510D9E|nr:pirin-like bicupin family protein [Labrenzia sp. 011]PVB59881.1 quercetin 2,3-dioxygenase [Labrenzia sp. 011]
MTLIHENMSRGHTTTGWLDSFHTFSFGNFRDPSRMGYAALRVINEDRIIPGAGFAEHGHEDMDILTLVLSGSLRHTDTIGNEIILAPGEVQLMSAGSGIRHAEMNASDTQPAHFLQIWLIPDARGGTPAYQQATLPLGGDADSWALLASGAPEQAPLRLLSDTRIYIAAPQAGSTMMVPVSSGRRTFIHVVQGLATLASERISSGDGLQIGSEEMSGLTWLTDGQVLLFDMA